MGGGAPLRPLPWHHAVGIVRPIGSLQMTKRSTSTSAFGVSKRESHDASGFYSRFTPPALSSDSEVAGHRALDKLIVGDSRRMDEVPDSSMCSPSAPASSSRAGGSP